MPFLSREQLHDLVWSRPARTAAKELGYSDTALRKKCAESDVPLPPQGYWNKAQAGKKLPPRKRLPARFPGMSPLTSVDSKSGTPTASVVFSETMSEVETRSRKLVGRISLPTSLGDGTHPIVKALMESDDFDFLRKFNSEPRMVDTPAGSRRMRILDALLRRLEEIGCRCSISRSKDVRGRPIQLVIGHQHLEIEVTQTVGAVRGMLSVLKVGRKVVFSDDGSSGPARRIADAAVGLLVAAEGLCRDRIARQASSKARQKEHDRKLFQQIREAEAKQRRLDEEKKVDLLLAFARDFERAATIRRFAEIVRAEPADAESEADLERWIGWAMEQADLLDPVRNGKLLASMDS